MENYEPVFEALDEVINSLTNENSSDMNDDSDDNDQESSHGHKIITNLKSWLNDYLKELPALGFNSGHYDINAIKKFVFPYLVKNNPIKFTVKKNNNFVSKNRRFKTT